MYIFILNEDVCQANKYANKEDLGIVTISSSLVSTFQTITYWKEVGCRQYQYKHATLWKVHIVEKILGTNITCGYLPTAFVCIYAVPSFKELIKWEVLLNQLFQMIQKVERYRYKMGRTHVQKIKVQILLDMVIWKFLIFNRNVFIMCLA